MNPNPNPSDDDVLKGDVEWSITVQSSSNSLNSGGMSSSSSISGGIAGDLISYKKHSIVGFDDDTFRLTNVVVGSNRDPLNGRMGNCTGYITVLEQSHDPPGPSPIWNAVASAGCADSTYSIVNRTKENRVDNHLVVGAPSGKGGAVLYRRGGDGIREAWIHVCTMSPDAGYENKGFGTSVSIRNDHNGFYLIAVGMPGANLVQMISVSRDGVCTKTGRLAPQLHMGSLTLTLTLTLIGGRLAPQLHMGAGTNVAFGKSVSIAYDEIYIADPTSHNGWYGSQGTNPNPNPNPNWILPLTMDGTDHKVGSSSIYIYTSFYF